MTEDSKEGGMTEDALLDAIGLHLTNLLAQGLNEKIHSRALGVARYQTNKSRHATAMA